ncbi:type I-E CRISPR-associated protein Cas6/Cse3/CasE [Desulfovibrio psychrotolerans]|uniref:Type I-E CRISPR-associated protein Cas6/Cse3/CasE n=1 Tax=Desulfovibrio psychrotolerans TaxID=415242 RepID=A0A7J0BUH0_9BACT|nr:type I-E CRISPR-associated protein Cas6/Cse3/CasE [Desulfovibrio psychrotolerans]GFM37359.1 type I-E CRISPR-associated protein Cas6/Cse3/CasE [Desulfovibrio psychrotolerans]
MWISKLVLDPRHAARSGLYDTHRLLWNLFADRPDRKRDFLFREQDDPHTFLTVSHRQPHDAEGWWTTQIKPYAPKLQQGEGIAFSLRANAVVKRNIDGKQRRFDVMQDARIRLQERQPGIDASDLPVRAGLAQSAGMEWLLKRQQELGLSIDPGCVQVDGCRVERFIKRNPHAGRSHTISLGIMDMQGTAQVEDPQKLLRVLFQGVGPAKGFGCGLLLVRRL